MLKHWNALSKYKIITLAPLIALPGFSLLFLLYAWETDGPLPFRLLLFCLPLVLAALYGQYVFRPLRYLIQNIEAFHKKLPSFVESDNHFLSMYICDYVEEQIKEVIHNEYEAKLLAKQAVIHSLQSQINPHFLYNTLESIRGKALEQGNTELADMVEALAIYFRYSIGNKSNIITLEDELKNLDNYIKIQKFRFGDRFTLDKNYVETPQLMQLQIPKMTLQPLVENALNHGIDSYQSGGRIRIIIEHTERNLYIHVCDNGTGISPEHLTALNQVLRKDYSSEHQNESVGIALPNVNNRIKLYFGNQYGLRIYSTVNVGTDVEIFLPALPYSAV